MAAHYALLVMLPQPLSLLCRFLIACSEAYCATIRLFFVFIVVAPVNKSLLSNLASAAVLAVGFSVQSDLFKSIGLFALSGALTNWLAIHMLFEKVPGLYGSGVIPSHFEELKVGIRELLMKQFFTPENMQRFLGSGEGSAPISLEPVIEKADLNPAFDGFIKVVEESSFGGMLAMVGGVEVLQPLREPFMKRMKTSLLKMTATDQFQTALRSSLASGVGGSVVHDKIQAVIDQRLDELSPQMVKQIMQDMIAKHLGWLVVWGAIFGGLIGAFASLL